MAIENMHTDNLVTWLEHEALKAGTHEQRERWAFKVLPEEELLQAARAELYKGFTAERWRKIEPHEVKHSKLCSEGSKRLEAYVSEGRSIEYETCDVTELSKEGFEAYRALEAQADVLRTSHQWFTHGGCTVKIELRTHWAECQRCHAEAFRSSASIRIIWAGRELAREYAL